MNITDEEYEKYIRFYLDTTLSCDIDIFARPPQGRDRSKVMFTNMVKHIKNASKEKGYLFSNPMLAAWNITSACNFRCEHCLYSGQEYSSKDDLTTEQALNLADELIDAGVAFVQLTGGEAFLRPDVMDIVGRFKENNVSVTLLTNGSLLTDKDINRLAELFNPYTDTVQISLDGATEETFKKIRHSDKFYRINENIKKLVDKGVIVDNVCTINSINKDEVCDIYKLSRSLGANKFVVGNIQGFTEEQDSLILDNKTLFKIYYDLMQIKEFNKSNILAFWDECTLLDIPEVRKIMEEEHYQELVQKQSNNPKLKSDCQSHNKIAIQSDGRMYLCTKAIACGTAPLGSYKENSFEEIWERRWNNVLFTPRNRENSECGTCKYNKFCSGGCKIDAYIVNKDINTPVTTNCYTGC